MVVVLTAAGCSQSLEPIFEQPHSPITWPPTPAAARIRFVGQLRSAADLKPPSKPFQALGDFLVGRRPDSPLYGPRSVVRCPDAGRLWIADPGGRCLHLFNLGDRSYLKIETVGDAHLLSPVGLCLGPEDSIYVCDSQSVSVHRLSASSGVLLATLRLPMEVQRPVAAAYEPATGELFVLDVCAHDIKVLGPDGTLRRIVGRRGDGAGEFNYPSDIAVGGGMIWIADTGNRRAQGLTQAGEHLITIGQAGDAPGDFAMPKGIALDSEGHIYVVDGRFENVQVFDRRGRLLLFFGEEGSDPGEFWLPSGIFIDPDDRIWVCDSYNGRVQVFDYLTLATSEHTPAGPARPGAIDRSPPPTSTSPIRAAISTRPSEVEP